jgi:hypothetical protein
LPPGVRNAYVEGDAAELERLLTVYLSCPIPPPGGRASAVLAALPVRVRSWAIAMMTEMTASGASQLLRQRGIAQACVQATI